MGAVTRDLRIEQGTSWSTAWNVRIDGARLAPADGWQARSQVRRAAFATDVLHQFTCAVVGDVVQVSVTAEDSSAWLWRRGVYDVEIFDLTGRVVRIVEGSVTVHTEVTR